MPLRRLAAGLVTLLLGCAALSPASHAAAGTSPATYTNPVSHGVLDSVADPTVIRAHDGYWYAFATTGPVLQSQGDQSRHYLPVLRSRDLVDWTYAGDVFEPDARPAWHPQDSLLFAPDVRYLDGRYYLYYSVAQPPRGPGKLFTVGVATAPTPLGPWTDSGGEVVQRGSCDTDANIDPAQLTAADGTRYLYWGSFRHLCVARLSADATRTVGEVTTVWTGFAEGAYVVRHGRYYYLTVSEGSCCNGAFSSYQVKVGRSTDPRGPFVDRQGEPLTAERTKGTPVLAANGNAWAGPGHHAVATDLSGQQWFAYHALDRADPLVDPPYMGPKRPLLLDRLDWVDGWPVVRAGLGPSDTAQAAPVTSWTQGSTFDDGDLTGWHGDGWRAARDGVRGGYVEHSASGREPAYLVSEGTAKGDVRAEADLRVDAGGAVGVVTAYRGPGDHVAAWLDDAARVLRTEVRVDGRQAAASATPLPASFDAGGWHNIAVAVGQGRVRAEVSDARQGDPQVAAELRLPAGSTPAGAVGVAAAGAPAAADNLGVAPLHEPVRELAPTPAPGRLLPTYSDDFGDGVAPGTQGDDEPWAWVRGPRGTESGGAFHWPTGGGELSGTQNSAAVLVRPAPVGQFTVETALTFEGDRTPNQQAGLLAYAGDDEYVKLVHSHTGAADPDRTEFASEGTTPDGRLGYGNNFVGPPARTTWLRMHHAVDPANGEHELTASTSTDGRTWVRGATWTLPAGADLRIGLVSQNAPGAVADFDGFRVHGSGRPR